MKKLQILVAIGTVTALTACVQAAAAEDIYGKATDEQQAEETAAGKEVKQSDKSKFEGTALTVERKSKRGEAIGNNGTLEYRNGEMVTSSGLIVSVP